MPKGAFAGACGGDQGEDTGRGRVGCADPPDEFQAAVVSHGSATSVRAGKERVARWEALLEVVKEARLAGLPEGCEI